MFAISDSIVPALYRRVLERVLPTECETSLRPCCSARKAPSKTTRNRSSTCCGRKDFIQKLDVRHPEKVARKEIALSVTGQMRYEDIAGRVVALRQKMKSEAAQFVTLAEEAFRLKHPGFVLPIQ